MKIETAKDIVNGVGALSGGSGIVTVVMAYLKMNAVELGVIVSIVTLIVYIIFQILYFKKLTLADENKVKQEGTEKKLDDHIEETKIQFNTVNNGISNILDFVKVDKE